MRSSPWTKFHVKPITVSLIHGLSFEKARFQWSKPFLFYIIAFESHSDLIFLDLFPADVFAAWCDVFWYPKSTPVVGKSVFSASDNCALPCKSFSAFLASLWPMRGTSDASHFWKGWATKYPSASNQRVKEAEISEIFHPPLESDERTVRWYSGVCFFMLEAIDI